MKKILITLCSFFFPLTLFCSTTFKNEWNKYENKQITHYKVLGERCSGTNFVSKLIARNFERFHEVGPSKYGHKHFIWWVGEPCSKETQLALRYDNETISFARSDHCLFIIVIRNSYDWIRSFFLHPHHVHPTLCHDFETFISSEWKLKEKSLNVGKLQLIDEFNPDTQKPFENVFKLRTKKIQNYLALRNIVANYIFVRYEDVAKEPEGFIDFLTSIYKLKRKSRFDPVMLLGGLKRHIFLRNISL